MIILPKRATAASTPAADKITLYCNSNEKLAYVNDGGTVFVPTYQTGASAWTPSVQFGGGTTGITYSTQIGRYVRIGDMVLASGYFVLTSKGSSTGSATFAGLPVNALNVASMYQVCNIWASNLTGVAGHLQGFITPATSGATLSFVGTGTVTTMTDAHFQDTTSCMFYACYIVDA
jgi:hypothetical protein